MKKPLIIILSIAVLILVLISGILGAAGYYLIFQRPQKSLEYNAKQLESFENLKSLKFNTTYSGDIAILTGIEAIDKLQENISTGSVELTKEYTFEENKILEKLISKELRPQDSAKDSQAIEVTKEDLILSDFIFMSFSDKDRWNTVISQRKYKLEEKTIDNQRVWEYTLDENLAKDIFAENFRKNITKVYSNPSIQISPDQVNVDTKGKVGIKLQINQSSKQLSRMEISFSEDISFGLSEEISAKLPIALGATENQKPSLKVIIKKDYKQEAIINEVQHNAERFKIMNQLDRIILAV